MHVVNFEMKIKAEVSRLGGRVDYFSLEGLRDQLKDLVDRIDKETKRNE